MNKPALLCLVFSFLLAACMAAKNPDISRLPEGRSERSYLRWLEKEAMYNRAPDLLAEVSQTERLWLNNASATHPEILLNAASAWLETTVSLADGNKSLFSLLRSCAGQLPGYGINGIYAGPLLETAELWQNGGNGSAGMISLDFDPKAGDAESFGNFMQTMESDGLQMGSDLLTAATGVGPDFTLQTRNAPGSQGLYAMLELPGQKITAASKDRVKAPPEIIADLARQGLIPENTANKRFAWLPENGWALTQSQPGLDGKTRRWIYRYYNSPEQPVLMWTDPFARAKRLFSAAIIQQTGLQGQSLTGLHILPWLGLEPAEESSAKQNGSIEAWLGILADLSSQIHSYGGWSLQADAVPASFMEKILAGNCDFCRDDVSELLACAALLTGRAEPLTGLYSGWLARHLDVKRLARGFNGSDEKIPAILENDNYSAALFKAASGKKTPSFKDFFSSQKLDQDRALSFLRSFRAGLPGLIFYNSEELYFPFFSDQKDNLSEGKLSDMADLRILLEARRKYNLGNGSLQKVYPFGKNGLGLLSMADNGVYWLVVMNFGSEKNAFSGNLPIPAASATVLKKDGDGNGQLSFSGRGFKISVAGQECLNIIFNP